MLHKKLFILIIMLSISYMNPVTTYSQNEELFNFPMEEGNVWTYLVYGFPICDNLECIYSKLEVIYSFSEGSRKCGLFEYSTYTFSGFSTGPNGVYFTEDDVTFLRSYEFQLCQDENRLYWFEKETDIEADFPDKYMIADFDRDDTQPWIIEYSEENPAFPYTLRRLIEKSTSEPYEYFFESYLAQNEGNLDGIFGYEFLYSPPGYLRDGTGFHIFGSDPNISLLKASWINGVLIGDTTFVYPTSINIPNNLPREIRLNSYPNPFNPTATTTFDLYDAAHTTLRVFDLHGREVAVLVDEVRSPGSHHVAFEAAHLSSGIYLVELSSGGMRTVKKVTLMK